MPRNRKSNRRTRQTARPGRRNESSSKPASPAFLAQPLAAERTMQLGQPMPQTEEAVRNLQRQATAEVARTIDLMADASLVPLHLLGAWSRVWTSWMHEVRGP
jgi:hypothetical protein